MDAIFGLVPHSRLRPVDHCIDHLVATMRGQTMQEDRVALGARHQSLVDLIGSHRRDLVMRMILPHRHPGIGNDKVGTRNRVARVAHNVDARTLRARVNRELLEGVVRIADEHAADLHATVEVTKP